MRQVIILIEQLRESTMEVLIMSKSGTGKELVARALHYAGRRARNPFVAVNCAALPASLIESELFGIGRGVATGVERRIGKIESAHSGTLFLDEPVESNPYRHATTAYYACRIFRSSSRTSQWSLGANWGRDL
jgi:transcriptional regulator with PAS, ATPase and Fis domain